MEYHGQEPGHKKYDLNFNLGSGKQLQEVKILIILFDAGNSKTHWDSFNSKNVRLYWLLVQQLNEISGLLENAADSKEKLKVAGQKSYFHSH